MEAISGPVILACPEDWADEVLLNATGVEAEEIMSVLDTSDITDDDSFDRHLRELAGETFSGCLVALAVK